MTAPVSPISVHAAAGTIVNKKLQMTYIIIKSTRNPATAPPALFKKPITGIWSTIFNTLISFLKIYLTTKKIIMNMTVYKNASVTFVTPFFKIPVSFEIFFDISSAIYGDIVFDNIPARI